MQKDTPTVSRWLTSIALGLFAAITVYLAILWLNDFAVTPDIAGLACAADRYAETGELGTYTNWNDFEMCWNSHTYTALQYTHGWIISLFHIPIDVLVQITPAIAFIVAVFSVAYISWRFTKRYDVTALTFILAIGTPSVLRSVLLTPQNLFGYALMGLGMALIAWQATTTRKKLTGLWLLLLLPLIGLLLFTHDLSFAVATTTFTLWAIFALPKRWWISLLLLLVGLGLLALELTVGFLPNMLANMLHIFLHSAIGGVYNTVFEHPAIFGYVVAGLAAVGIFGSYRNNMLSYEKAQVRTLLLIAVLVSVLFGQASLVDIGLLPNRFIPFAWLGLLPFAAIGLVQLRAALHMQDASHWRGILWYAVAGIVVVSQMMHGIRYVQDDIVGWAERYKPRTDFSSALEALDAYDPDGRLLGIQVAPNQEILIAPLWYSGNVLYYPWFNLNHRDIFAFEVVNEDSRLASAFKNTNGTVYKRTRQMYDLITSPGTTESEAAIDALEIDYLILPKPSQPYRLIWQDITAGIHPLIIENEYYAIYQLRN